MRFEEEYSTFMERHKQKRTGECLRRLQEGHSYAERLFLEKVWWPLFHHFKYLHPEFEVNDFRDGKRYLDFAYIRSNIRICFEIDGYGPHLKNISRWQFADQLNRQNQLVLEGWIVIRFSLDQVTDHPRHCQQVTQQVIGRLISDELDHLALSYREKENLSLFYLSPFLPHYARVRIKSLSKSISGTSPSFAARPNKALIAAIPTSPKSAEKSFT